MARPKLLQNKNYMELQDEAGKRGIDPTLDIEDLRAAIIADQEGDIKAPTPGEMVQEAMAEDEDDKPVKSWVFATEKARITKALKPFAAQGLIVGFGDPSRDQDFYSTTFNGHMESAHITNDTNTVRRRAAIQMQSVRPLTVNDQLKDVMTYV